MPFKCAECLHFTLSSAHILCAHSTEEVAVDAAPSATDACHVCQKTGASKWCSRCKNRAIKYVASPGLSSVLTVGLVAQVLLEGVSSEGLAEPQGGVQRLSNIMKSLSFVWCRVLVDR